MPAFDYARSRATAERLIARFGGQGELRRSAEPSDGDMTNGLTPEAAGGVAQTSPCALCVIDYSDEERASSLIQQNDRRALVSTRGLAFRPDQGMQLVLFADADPYEIVSCKPLAPAGIDVLYDCQVRR